MLKLKPNQLTLYEYELTSTLYER